jgi:hypothetical protein
MDASQQTVNRFTHHAGSVVNLGYQSVNLVNTFCCRPTTSRVYTLRRGLQNLQWEGAGGSFSGCGNLAVSATG